MKRDQHHVMPSPNGGWSVRQSGALRASRTFDKQADAVAYARDKLRKNGGELFVHGKDGTVRSHDTYAKQKFG
ncbi:hypothetical protein CCR97_25640 [Rhodoplanes elegans]|uniref:DUF2188 domain-containing protein n=1 Tax=Rhodoplanes elegans TaxID=29408 RepID=A0A327KRJ6_9BRAD|nr:DUF2188 domain-containing protein [Rhodoplanes elegans]MBK5961563.1 hypothetical protein [Rhodoplanes elegans]RAI39975.1 hypothetical protein CH338_07735 [Rhodoplanes elegans]